MKTSHTCAAWSGYLRRYRPVRWVLLRSVSMLMTQSALVAPVAFFIKIIFDGILQKRPFEMLLLPSSAILLCVCLAGFLSCIARHGILHITKVVIAELRVELLTHAWRLGDAAAGERTQLHSLIVHDTERVDVMSNAIVSVFLPSILTAAIMFIALLIMAPVLLLAVLCVLPVSLTVSRLLGLRLKVQTALFHDAFENFSQGVLSTLRLMPLTRALGAEQLEASLRARQTEMLRRVSVDMALTATTYAIVQTSVTAVITLVTLLAGGSAVLWGHMSLGTLAASYVIVTQLGMALNALWNMVPPIVSGHKSLIDMHELMSRRDLLPEGGSEKRTLQGEVEFHAVSFSHGDAPLLHALNLKLSPGEQIAIMGANGAGKSTMAQLLLGFFSPHAGTILIDGTPISHLSLVHLRRQIGVVLQEPLLFDGTVMENIAYGRLDVDAAAVRAAAVLTGANAVIQALPQGYDTRLGAGGLVLSGGQCQLLAVTRALLGEPKLLVLDEPTNHLDMRTGQALCRMLRTLPFRPTILLITHDIAIAQSFRRVLHLQHNMLDEPASIITETAS